MSEAIIAGARIMWSYADDVDDEPDPEEGGRTAEIKASGGETLTYGSFVDPGRVVIVKVHSIGRNGKASTNAFPAPNSDYITNATGIITNLAAPEVRFTSAIDATPELIIANQPQSQAGFNARINALETGPASAIPRPRVLAGTYNGSATVFTDQLPSVPDLAYDCVIFLSNELLIRDVSTPPGDGRQNRSSHHPQKAGQAQRQYA